MADNEEGRAVPAQGNEWEVVSLTASAYAASPGPVEVKSNDDNQGLRVGEDKEDTPEEVKGDTSELAEQVDEDAPDFVADFADGKGRSLSMGGTELEEGMALHGLTLLDKEQSIYSTAKFSSFHGEETIGGFAPDEEKIIFSEPIDPEEGLESNVSQSPKYTDEVHEDKDEGSDLPRVDWWKKRAASLYAQAKEANAVWSILFAAAVMGVVMIGHKWHQSKWQCGDEKMKKVLGPFSGLKSILVGGQPRGSVVRGSTTSQL
ncbi:ATG8-interacting protein 2 [Heracleum sosnowskyi]|uniref:ATG8-interacting protein 2 n=1 Tax=Heracleum sosnowskyi TaxID=360622 RepID=A0AAD8M878_9APIA|nr:ATG8-interacting protein 2 [Heracleum sosnowskyi]